LRGLTGACALLVWLAGCPARAQAEQAADVARAEELFRRGKDYLARNDHELACSMLAESYRLDPATGSLLALAMCHEQGGKLASAYRAYAQVVVRARARGQTEREQAAEAKLEELGPKLSMLTIVVAEQAAAPGLTVRVNDAVLTPEELGSALPVDGGAVRIEASQPGKATWRSELTVLAAGEARRVVVPPLLALPNERQGAPRPALVVREVDLTTHKKTPAQKAGLGLLGAGSAGVAVGLVLVMRAAVRDRQADVGCASGTCDVEALRSRADADAARDAARLSLIAGASVATAGLATFLVGRRRRSSVALTVDPRLPARAAGIHVHASF
jgi:hypothetical protein